MSVETSVNLIYWLDLVGTASFAFSGALRGLDRRPDFVGMAVLAGATAIGGGIVRDVILARPVKVLADVNYGIVILVSAAIAFLFPAALKKRESMFQYFDAVGLGIFSAIGASFAYSAGLNPISLLFVAAITGAGGGIIRDVLLGRMPVVLYREVYISAVAAGAMALLAVRYFGGDERAGFLAAWILTTVIRVISIIKNWSLPRLNSGQK
jgi:uncharacterized membrane protein YeiH